MSARMNADWRMLPGLPSDPDGPVFAAPWQAQAFAMTVHLHAQGLFEWTEWASALSDAIRAAQKAGDADLGDTYYLHWLDALEDLLRQKRLAGTAQLDTLRDAWAQAAQRTPHGMPIELDPAVLAQLTAPGARSDD